MTSLALAELLRKDSLRDPKAVAGCLQQHRPDICHDDTLCVRRTWRKTCGDDVVKNSSTYKAGLNEVIERAEQMARGATGREERAWAGRVKERVIAFDELSICNQRNFKASGRLEQTAARSYTGSVVVDRMLADLVRVPESAELPGPPAHTAAAASASAPTVDGRATTQQLHTQGNGCAADRLSAAARALMDDMLAMVDYSRPKVFELVCALAFMCGRSLAELMATGQFSAAERERERAPYPWVLSQASPSSKTNINSRFCKSANTAAKTVLGVASSAFSDVRALYVGLTLALYGSAKTTSKQMSEWTRRCSEENEIKDVKARAGGSCAAHAGTSGLDATLISRSRSRPRSAEHRCAAAVADADAVLPHYARRAAHPPRAASPGSTDGGCQASARRAAAAAAVAAAAATAAAAARCTAGGAGSSAATALARNEEGRGSSSRSRSTSTHPPGSPGGCCEGDAPHVIGGEGPASGGQEGD
ncbi:hypothetical protein JKP88DRAFT_284104 [Tribonema minus]|uniref:Uncharacterized protein n=1 Tax=Tribonema minus TaxID=303371 RepID=A0A836C7S3_9STRA|nr:hypothetical protein JKP88DRAFT_284104 [Tribonema minus]